MMEYYADLHIHSRFAMATSRSLDLTTLERGARLKGLTVLGTGDFTHPAWLAELEAELTPAPESGLYMPRAAYASPVRFMLSVEIASIFTQGGRGRRMHTLVMLPSFEAVRKFNKSLIKQGANLASDGRPIVGLSARQIAYHALDANPEALVIPAHIWTPWFGALGSKSGFDSLEECFEELTPEVLAVETGLSSDPPMNWRLSALDDVALISASDAHSAAKLGREATFFRGEISYQGIREALRAGAPVRATERAGSKTELAGTLELLPEQGKYHYDGHRVHGIRWSPEETIRHNGICPVCGRPITVGVLSRVNALADRPETYKPTGAPDYKSMLSLPEILAQALNVGTGAKKVAAIYEDLIAEFSNEMSVLLKVPLSDIAAMADNTVAAAIERARNGKLSISPGYDGRYGAVRLNV